MSPSRETYRAPGKLLLFGEHSAVFGYPAVGTTLTRGLQLVVSPAERMRLVVDGDTAGADSETATALSRFAEFLTERAPHLPPSQVEITSDLPISSGFGSSAALCTALAQWSLAAEPPHPRGEPARGGEDRPEMRSRAVWHRAHELEAFFHGTPSGIDTGLAALGGVQAFHFDATQDGGPSRASMLPAPTRLSGEVPSLVVGSIPRSRSTRELVAMVRQQREERPAATETLLRELGSSAEEAIAFLSRESANPTVLGEIAAAAQKHLSRLGVSSAALDQILHTGSKAGALGGKLSGAGDGGAFYLVCSDPEVAEAVHAAVARELPPQGLAFTR